MDLINSLVHSTLADTYKTINFKNDVIESKLDDNFKRMIANTLSSEKCIVADKEMRGYGKTTLMLKLANLTGHPLVCYNPSVVRAKASYLGLNNVRLYSIKEIDRLKQEAKKTFGTMKVLIDDVSQLHYDELSNNHSFKLIGFIMFSPKDYIKTPLDICKQIGEDSEYVLDKCAIVN